MNYEDLVDDLVSTIRLGYEAEGKDPAVEFHMPAGDEVAWLAAWIIVAERDVAFPPGFGG